MKKFLYYVTLIGPVCDLIVSFIGSLSSLLKKGDK